MRAKNLVVPDEMRRAYPFLTCVVFAGEERVGIVQNCTGSMVMFYDFSRLESAELKREFLRCGERWWYESNTMVPIDAFIGPNFDVFKHALRGYHRKDISSIVGPALNMGELHNRRIKKRKVEFLRG